jgi:hypothetical protein
VKSINNFVCKFELKKNRDSLAGIVILYYPNDQGSEVRFLKVHRNFSLILSVHTSSFFHSVSYSDGSGCYFCGFKAAMA